MAPKTSQLVDFTLLDLSDCDSSSQAPSSTETSMSNTTISAGKTPVDAKHPPTLQELSKQYNLEKNLSPSKVFLHWDLAFEYSSDTFYGKSSGETEWVAKLMVFSPHIPRLMREGFYWSSKNIVPELNALQGYCTWTVHKCRKLPGKLFNVRRYLLMDLSEECLWTACLMVSCPDGKLSVLSQFRPEYLTIEKMIYCLAVNTKINAIMYNYESAYPHLNFNVIYDDMPLKGHWPWPKGEGENSKESESEKVQM